MLNVFNTDFAILASRITFLFMKLIHSRAKLPFSIWILGFVSMFMDISSEIIHSLLPLFLTQTLATSPLILGLIEGVGESVAMMMKVFSGVLSDYLGRRKELTVLGYALGALSKPLFALATSSYFVLAARVFDRIGKGIRGAPRDALVAEFVPYELRGRAYGLRQTLDTVGALIGPLFAVGLMLSFADHFRLVFWIALIPALVSLLLLVVGIKEPERQFVNQKCINPLNRHHLSGLSPEYWWLVLIGAIFTLARFSEAFLVLRAMNLGLSLAFAPFVMVMMNAVYALSAYPFGALSDRIAYSKLLKLGILVLMAADFCLAMNNRYLLFIGVALWGLHMGMTQGVLAAMLANIVPKELYGSAFGFFNFASGLMMLFASIVAGFVWAYWGPSYTFYIGILFSILAFLGLIIKKEHHAS